MSDAAEVFHSGIYKGWLRHRRFSPRCHEFNYQVFMMYLDLSELDRVLDLSPWWSRSRWSLARYVRSDFLGDSSVDLDCAIRTRIKEEAGVEHTGPIRLLANLRYFGFNINPIVTYYCFDEQEHLQYIVAEVTNTPWKEKKSYVLRCDPNLKQQRINFNKGMHVSPFNPMDMRYFWRSNNPAKRLSLNIETWRDDDVELDATLSLKRVDISRQSLNRTILRYPWMTVKVAGAIYWQAIKLLHKRVPFYGHPDTPQ